MDNNGIDPNQGTAGGDNSGSADLGNQGGNSSQPSGSDGQGGTAPDARDQRIKDLETNLKSLNQALVDSRRGSLKGQTKSQDPGNLPDANSPEGQYAIALQVAENSLRSRLEEVLPLYPELKDHPEIVQRIRTNPWAFAKREAFLTGNWELGALDVEQAIADEVDRLSSQTAPSQNGKPTPAMVNNNPVQTQQPQGQGAQNGSGEDENPWTMPMDKLE